MATVVYYDNICNIIVKVRDRFIQNPALQFPAVLHTVSLLSKTNVFEHASEHQRNETSQFCEHTASTQLRTFYKNRKPNGLVKKGFDEEETVKNSSDRCCRTNKAGIQNQLFAEQEF